MQLYTLMGILFLNFLTLVASQTDKEETFEYFAVSDRTKQRYVHTTANWVENFGVNLTKEIAKRNHYNFAFSSLGTTLGMTVLSMGARRHTEQLMRKKMGFDAPHITRKVGFHEFINRLSSYKGLDFAIACAVFVPHRMRLEPTVVEAVELAFLSTIKQVNFSEPNITSGIINQWCEEHTHGYIKDIVQPADFNAQTSLVLVDAIRFTGAWLENFDPTKTRDMPFYCADGKVRTMKTMIGRQLLRYSEHAPTNSRIVELPFKGSEGSHNLSLVLILPKDKEGRIFLEENFHTLDMEEILKNGKLSDVKIHIPKLNIAAETDLIQPLKNMGLDNLFDPTHADFGGFFPPPEPYFDPMYYPPETISRFPGFYLNKIVQKAHIEIHEGNATNVPVDVSEYLVSSLYSLLTDSVEFIANHTFYGTVVSTGVDPITVFTFRHSGIAAPNSLIDILFEIF